MLSFGAMIKQEEPLLYYQQQVAEAGAKLQVYRKKKNMLGWLRLISILVPLVLAFALLPNQVTAAVSCIVICVACFVYVVSVDIKNSAAIEFTERHITINENEISILHHQYEKFEDGKQFEPAEHDYAGDIDIFGKHSLYQYLNRCESQQGRALFAANLLKALPAEHILANHEAIKELSPQTVWRQTFQNHGKTAHISIETENRVIRWLKMPERIFGQPLLKYIFWFYPVIPSAVVFLYINEIIPFGGLSFLLLILLLLSSSFTKRISQIHEYVSRIAEEINTLHLQLQHTIAQQWNADALCSIQQLIKQESSNAPGELLKLKKILDKLDTRLNIWAMLFLNTFFLWDIRQAAALQRWKINNSTSISKWFSCIAQMEVINTLSTLHFNHPGWVFPQLSGTYFNLEAEVMGHPLIPAEKRVSNSCVINGYGQVMLVTGSNMAGKSTFLRSLGVNTVLTMMGAPVCAKKFIITPVTLISSMRIADNLAESTSTFYAELKKLQKIIEKVNRHEQVFILLDEILRGTNSLDRHTGSVALLKQMIKQKAVSVVATHDIPLSTLQEQYPAAIHNFHFDVQVKGEDLFFDYKLKEGVCTSMNASILMKKIGIHMEEGVED